MNWLLLRGLGRHSGFWHKFPKQLEEELSVQTLCLDLPGLNGEKTSFITIDDIVDEMRSAWLDKKGSGEWSIMAISLGGMIALNWCSRYPQDFSNVVTINSSDRLESSLFERLTPTAIKYLAKIVMDKNIRGKEKKVLEVTTNLVDINKDLLDYFEMIGKNSGMTVPLVIRQLWAAFRFRAPRKLVTPYLVLTSKGDQFVKYHCSEKLAKKYGARLRVHDTAGHDIPMDDPNWVIEQIKNC